MSSVSHSLSLLCSGKWLRLLSETLIRGGWFRSLPKSTTCAAEEPFAAIPRSPNRSLQMIRNAYRCGDPWPLSLERESYTSLICSEGPLYSFVSLFIRLSSSSLQINVDVIMRGFIKRGTRSINFTSEYSTQLISFIELEFHLQNELLPQSVGLCFSASMKILR